MIQAIRVTGLSRPSIWLLILLAWCGVPGVNPLTADEKDKPVAWETPGVALEKSIPALKPVLVYLKTESDSETDQKILGTLEDSGLKKMLPEILLLQDQWSRSGNDWRWKPLSGELASKAREREISARKLLEKLITASGGKSVVAVFDPYLHQGTVLTLAKLRASNLRKAIRASTKICDGFRRSRGLAEKLLDKAQLQVQDSRNAEALRTLAGMKRFRFPAGEPLLSRQSKLMEVLEERWKKARFEAREMERANRLAAAASRLEEILKEFPHPEWEKEIREDIGRVWRRIQGPGGGTPNR